MLDIGLVASGAAVWLVLAGTARWLSSSAVDPGELLDRLAVPTVTGILAGRLVAALLDDPESLRSLQAFLVVRGGVEFWPGAFVTIALAAAGVARRKRPVVFDLADLTPFLLWGYATYEVTCLVRDGCYGPASPFGLTPQGLRTRMFPVGLVVALAVAMLGILVRQLWAWAPLSRILLAVGGVAAVRSVASIWLPRLEDDLTRQHVESLVVLLAAVIAAACLALARVHGRRGSLEDADESRNGQWRLPPAGEAS